MRCVMCGSKVRLEPISVDKEKRITNHNYFNNYTILKKVCRNCGYVSYEKVRK